MKIARSRAELEAMVGPRRAERLAMVPTMGNLHAGHLRLVDEARVVATTVVASIFVNPMQFGPGEDLARYPRTPEADLAQLEEHRCHIVYMPDVSDLYPFGTEQSVRVHVPGLSDILCGASRPGHFDGVATVVSKLLLAVRPHVAVFGRKDFQQLRVIERLVDDLGFPVEVLGCPTAREPDGLAMSSRNAYLDPESRSRAPALHGALRRVADALAAGVTVAEAREQGLAALRASGIDPEYLEIRRSGDLGRAGEGDAPLVALVAARLGGARLIDNVEVERPG